MDEQDAQRNADSGVRIHDYNPENANGGNGSQPAPRTFEGKEEVRTRARTFDSPEIVQPRARTFEGQDNAGQVTRELSHVARVSVDTSGIGATSMVHLFLAWQRELCGFVNTRVTKNLQFLQQLSDTRAPSDFGRIQSQYAQDAITDYTFGVQQVLARSLSVAREGGEDVRHGAEEAASHLRGAQEVLAPRD